MCTLTIVRAGGLLRMACNRDEARQRMRAHPPFITVVRGRRVLTPQDPQGGGTWIAANSWGLVFAVLNAYDRRAAAQPQRPSRGSIIPMVVDCDSLDEVASRIGGIPRDAFAPCRVLAADGCRLIEVGLAASRRQIQEYQIDRPLLFTSSSLGDSLVDGPRRLLFEEMVCGAADVVAQQDAFHAHRWRDRPALSVHMSRPDACTVSTTIVETTPREVRMTYQPAHCVEGIPVGLIIDREHVGYDAASWPRCRYAAV